MDSGRQFSALLNLYVKHEEGSYYDPLAQSIESEYYEKTIRNAWKNANRLVKKQGIEHSIDEATALHWTLYIKELEWSVGTVRLGRKRHSRLASAASREDLGPSQLAARIIDQWLKQQEEFSARQGHQNG